VESILIPKLSLQGKKFELKVPSSKSLANRALVLAALSRGVFQLHGDFEAEDIQLMLKALQALGVQAVRMKKGTVFKNDLAWMDDERDLELFLGNAGTALRFLTSLVLFRKGKTVVTGNERMQHRPIGDLVDALRQLGAEIDYLKSEGYPPLVVHGLKRKSGGLVRIKGNMSSQFVSSLLLVASAFEEPLEIVLEGKLVSRPYVEMTIDLLRRWDISVQYSTEGFRVFPQQLVGMDAVIEGDASAATYWWALEYLHGCVINVLNVQNDSKQGDMQFQKVLNMLKTSSGPFQIDMNDMPDAALTLMALAPFHHSEIVIKNIGNLRVKESDRIEAMSTELRKCGVQVEVEEDWIRIGRLRNTRRLGIREGIKIETYGDHRIAMSMAVFATMLGDLEIMDPDCVGKTYSKFWNHLKMLY